MNGLSTGRPRIDVVDALRGFAVLAIVLVHNLEHFILLAGVAVFILQMLFCRWWLSRHRQGPLDYVWHKWTWIGTGR